MQRIVICDNCSGIGIGAVMQNVAVAVVDADRGIRRTATTDSAGQYRFTSLPPVAYDISVAMPGFESQIQKNVALSLVETLVVDFRMKVSAGKEVVEVTSEPPVVDSARGSQAGVIEERSINELSIDRRDYLTFLRFLAWDHLTGLFKQNLKDLKRLFLQPDLGPVPTQFSRLEINFERSEANYSARCIGTLHLTNSTPTLAETASGRPFGTGGRVLWRFYAKPVRT